MNQMSGKHQPWFKQILWMLGMYLASVVVIVLISYLGRWGIKQLLHLIQLYPK
tara:strand:- start:1120 stop:1278 length:159 start_codon:yes stop_codon:yes gene_type:complete